MNTNSPLSKAEFAEKFMSVLMPLEQNVLSYYKKMPTAMDHEILSMYQYFSKVIKAKMTNYTMPSPNVNGPLETLYHAEANFIESACKKVSLEDLKECLKMLEKSVELWNREMGVQGYLNFIEKNMPDIEVGTTENDE